MSISLLRELRAIDGQFEELEANLLALKELGSNSAERLSRIQVAERSAKRASQLIQLQIDKLTPERPSRH